MAKKNGGKKVSNKRKSTSDYKWAKVLGWDIEELKERLDIIEEFLGEAFKEFKNRKTYKEEMQSTN